MISLRVERLLQKHFFFILPLSEDIPTLRVEGNILYRKLFDTLPDEIFIVL